MKKKFISEIDKKTNRVILGSIFECECTHRRFNVMSWDKRNVIKCVRCGKRYIYDEVNKDYIAE